ncbi:MAG: hypothetical protein CMI79_05790 [Candidatus Pelagibacter sp.]|nr:hypothetical protein [Candidatus Pelagibacter sp.]
MIAILTTKTLHHVHFVNEIFKKNRDIICIVEKKIINPNFKSKVFFERQRENFEKKIWFAKSKPNFDSKVNYFYDINSKKVLNFLLRKKVKFILLFGTGKINLKIYKKYINKIFNFHGGNPEKYRGLDSHYWALYHKDFGAIETCLHQVKQKLDTGKIVYRKKIKINSNTKIYELRKKNTDLCIKFAIKFINNIKKGRKIILTRQKSLGRYYSFMPAVLKENLRVRLKK